MHSRNSEFDSIAAEIIPAKEHAFPGNVKRVEVFDGRFFDDVALDYKFAPPALADIPIAERVYRFRRMVGIEGRYYQGECFKAKIHHRKLVNASNCSVTEMRTLNAAFIYSTTH